jgi:hypothetical protein
MPCSYGIYFYFSLYTPKNTEGFQGKTRVPKEIRIARKRIIFISQSNVPSSFLKAVSTFALDVFLHSLDFHLFFASLRILQGEIGKERKNNVVG